MKSLYLKAILAGLLMTVTSLSHAGLITMEASYDSETAAEFSWNMTLDETDLNTQISDRVSLNSSGFDFIVSFNVIFNDSDGTRFSLNLDELKIFEVEMQYFHLDSMLFVADGTNQLPKVEVINFGYLGAAFASKGTEDGPSGRNRDTLTNDHDEFRLSSFKSIEVPEPSSILLLVFGIIGIALRKN